MRIRLVASLVLLVACVGDSTPIQSDGGGDATTDGAPQEAATDSPNGADAEASAPFTPASFGSALALWLVGDQVSATGGAVDTWYDQSSYKSDATQPQAASRPLVEKGVLATHDVVDFNGNGVTVVIAAGGDAGTTPANLSFGQTDDLLIEAVVSTSPNMPAVFAWMKAPTIQCTGSCKIGDGLVLGANLNGGVDQLAARESQADPFLSTSGQPLGDHGYHVVAARRIGETDLQLRIDAIPKDATITGFDVSQPQLPLAIGAVSLGTFNGTFAFRMAELVAVHKSGGASINDAEVASVEAYLKAKYHTP